MPCLPHDPSIYFDDDCLADLIAEFSTRLRRNGALRGVLDKLIGNYWFDFEQNLHAVGESILFQQNLQDDLIDGFVDKAAMLSAQDIERLGEVFLDSCLTIFPLHAAASVNELFEKTSDIMHGAVAGGGSEEAFQRARTILKAGSIFR